MSEWLITRTIENGAILFPALAVLFVVSAALLVRRRSWLRWSGAALCAAAVALCALGFFGSRKLTGTIARRAGEFSFRIVEGRTPRTLADYRGKVVVLNFWATWCDACVTEMPDLEALAQRYAGSGLTVLTVSDEAPEKLRIPVASARVSAFISGDIAPVGPLEKLACQGRPSTVVIDRGGNVREVLIGEHSYAAFESSVRNLL